MARKFSDEIREVKAHWKNYLFQSLLATVSLFCVLMFLERDNEVIVASLGATAFVVFALPKNITAQPRNVIGGHIVGLALGFAGFWLLNSQPNPDQLIAKAAMHALSVGLAMLAMVVFDMEHPPACGTALGVAIRGVNARLILGVLFFAVFFTVVRLLAGKHLRDLT